MNVGKTLFAQIMEFVPWTSFGRIVDRYSGNAGVRRMTCAEQFRVMAFAQLTWRESLRDIEVTLGANASKLYAMGLRHSIHRSTLADANESRDAGRCQRVARLAHLVGRGRAPDSSGTQALQRYRLGRIGSEEHGLRVGRDHDRSVFESVRLGSVSQSQGGRQAAHAVGPAGRNPSVYPHQRRQDARSQCAGLHANRSWSVLRDGSGLLGFHSTLWLASSRRVLCNESQSQHERSTNLFQARRSVDRSRLRSNGIAQRVLRHATLPRELEAHTIQRYGKWEDFHLSDQQLRVAATDDCNAVQKSLASRIVLQMDQAAPENQEVPGQQRERRQDANLVRRVDLRTDCHRQEGTSN